MFPSRSCRSVCSALIAIVFLGLLTAAPLLTHADENDLWWDGFGSPPGQGLDNEVEALCVYGDLLIAAGWFQETAAFVAVWNGTAWSPLGSGLNGYGDCACASGSDLYVGGSFNAAGGKPANRIARWDGAAWQVLGSGTDAPVHALTFFDGDLVAGGDFTHAGGVEAHWIARWDGAAWHPLGAGPGGPVSSLYVHDGMLIAGGSFGIRRWTGAEWTAMGSGLDGSVEAMTTYGGALIATGNFLRAGSTWVYHIASWNGASWSPLGSGLSWLGRSLCVLNGDLYVGGWFGSPSSYVSRWDGSAWHSLGSGTDYYVSAVCPWNGDLYVGGEFYVAGGKPSLRIARWTALAPASTPPGTAGAGDLRLSAPNPYVAGDAITVFAVSPLRSAAIYDPSGRRVRSLHAGADDATGSRLLHWDCRAEDGAPVPSGVFYIRVVSAGGTLTRPIVRIR